MWLKPNYTKHTVPLSLKCPLPKEKEYRKSKTIFSINDYSSIMSPNLVGIRQKGQRNMRSFLCNRDIELKMCNVFE